MLFNSWPLGHSMSNIFSIWQMWSLRMAWSFDCQYDLSSNNKDSFMTVRQKPLKAIILKFTAFSVYTLIPLYPGNMNTSWTVLTFSCRAVEMWFIWLPNSVKICSIVVQWMVMSSLFSNFNSYLLFYQSNSPIFIHFSFVKLYCVQTIIDCQFIKKVYSFRPPLQICLPKN